MRNATTPLLPALLLAGLLLPSPARAEGEVVAYSGTGTLTAALLYQGAITGFERNGSAQLTVVDPDIPLERGVEKLLAGEIQVLGSGTAPPPRLLEAGGEAFLLGQDALAVWVNADNPVAGVSRGQLRAILTGEIASWDRLGGAPVAVRAFLPPFGAGYDASDLADWLLLGGRPPGGEMDTLHTAPWEQIARVAQEPGGVCLASPTLGGILSPEIAARVKVIPLDGVLPTPEAVAGGDYLLNHPLYLLTPGPPQGAVKQLVEYLTGPEGQALMAGKFLPSARPPAAGRLSAPGQNREKPAASRKPSRPDRGKGR